MKARLTDSDVAAIISGRLATQIDASELSAAEIARRLDVSPACVSNWRNNRRELSSVKLYRMAALLGVPAWELLPDTGGTDGPQPSGPPACD